LVIPHAIIIIFSRFFITNPHITTLHLQIIIIVSLSLSYTMLYIENNPAALLLKITIPIQIISITLCDYTLCINGGDHFQIVYVFGVFACFGSILCIVLYSQILKKWNSLVFDEKNRASFNTYFCKAIISFLLLFNFIVFLLLLLHITMMIPVQVIIICLIYTLNMFVLCFLVLETFSTRHSVIILKVSIQLIIYIP